MSAVATETICFGETSMSWTSSGGTEAISVVAPKKLVAPRAAACRSSRLAACGAAAHEDAVVVERAVGVERRVGLGDDVVLFLVGGQVDDLVGDLAVRRPCGTGVSMKPNSLTRA